ncbi:MAG TPA: isoprenylcysteine carboxylmethyltransferase family protein [Candidatus Acidoferrum sp.]|nr:isoprenylcysteine carboxylmethyltransferase family protein [Candidatus Acidoferrum sp.]
MKIALRSAGFTLALLAVIFIPAGTLKYWQAWTLIGVYAVCGTWLAVITRKRNRALFELRMKQGPRAEKSPVQRVIVTLLYAGYLAEFVLAALDHRSGWSVVPPLVAIAGDAIVVLGFYVYFIVMRENSFASGAIELNAGQHVVSTGPYGIIRHPMYVGLLLTLFGVPLAMGSYWALTIFAAEIVVIVWRLLDEEQFLVENLPGYAEYRTQTRWRLVPGLF